VSPDIADARPRTLSTGPQHPSSAAAIAVDARANAERLWDEAIALSDRHNLTLVRMALS
jgi:hypothetical protein